MLASYYADIKPAVQRGVEAAQPYVDEWGPVLRALSPLAALAPIFEALPEAGPTPRLDQWMNSQNDDRGAFSNYWLGAQEATEEEKARAAREVGR